MRLSQLLPNIDPGNDPQITALCEDSRKVIPGSLFVAQRGQKQHGIAYLTDALSRGAAALIVPQGTEIPEPVVRAGIPVIAAENPRHLIGTLAARLYPRQPEKIAAVTGTSGKTSTAWFAQQILEQIGKPSCSLGTLGIQGKIKEPGTLTTPEAAQLHQILDRLAGSRIEHLVMEASSQGLDQHRLDHVHLTAAGFTNLSRDHLDYHRTTDAYLKAKARLFTDLLPANGVAVLNADSEATAELQKTAQNRGITVWTYGFKGKDFQILSQTLTPSGQQLDLEVFGQKISTHLPIAGKFQAANALCALGLVLAMTGKEQLNPALKAFETLSAPPGRLEAIPGHPKGAAIYIDYAHKPDALKQVLEALRPHTTGQLVLVFGCGGDRDPGKRSLMGEIAAQKADRVIITDDNPRSENPAAIRAAIRAACPAAIEIPDRAQAIRTAINELKSGDVLIIAGKGHESGQIFAGHTLPFSDEDQARAALHDLVSRMSESAA